MRYTIYTEPQPGIRVYQASAADLNKAVKACAPIARVHRCPIVMVPRNPRFRTIRYNVPQIQIRRARID